jgi:hypothetical protein
VQIMSEPRESRRQYRQGGWNLGSRVVVAREQ